MVAPPLLVGDWLVLLEGCIVEARVKVEVGDVFVDEGV